MAHHLRLGRPAALTRFVHLDGKAYHLSTVQNSSLSCTVNRMVGHLEKVRRVRPAPKPPVPALPSHHARQLKLVSVVLTVIKQISLLPHLSKAHSSRHLTQFTPIQQIPPDVGIFCDTVTGSLAAHRKPTSHRSFGCPATSFCCDCAPDTPWQ